MWCVAEVNEAYLERMEEVLEIYEKPYNPLEPVVCLDEKPVVLHRDLRPPTQAQPQQPAKRDHEYKRCERPTSSAPWNRLPGAILRGPRRTVPAGSSPRCFSESIRPIQTHALFIWSWTT